jgi:hypothetical protein
MLHRCGIDARAGMLSPERSDVQEVAITQEKRRPGIFVALLEKIGD